MVECVGHVDNAGDLAYLVCFLVNRESLMD